MPPELAEVRAWVLKADNDRPTAQATMERSPPITDTAAFHCQQAVEKLSKTFLLHHRVPIEKTHDLEVLLDQCRWFDTDFESLRLQVRPLTVFAVRLRYPVGPDPSVEQVRSALDAVGRVRSFVLHRLPPEIAP